MSERRFEILLSWVLLCLGVLYGVRMYLYPSDAGRVPTIVAAVMVGALVVQLIVLYGSSPAPVPSAAGEPSATADATDKAAKTPHPLPSSVTQSDIGAAAAESERPAEPEPDTYQTLIALTPVRRRRFWAISGFAVGFAAGIPLVGFVVTAGVMVAGVLAVGRERPATILVGGGVAAMAAYGLVAFLLDTPPFQGHLFG